MTQQDKFIMIDMDDPKLKKISEMLSNKTAKKIIDYLTDNKEASENDLSIKLKVPLNTIEYNLKKLLETGIVQKHKSFFWSKKGKKILMYELSRKSIVISPRGSNVGEKLKSLVPGFIVISALSFVTYVYERMKFGGEQIISKVSSGISEVPQALYATEDFITEEGVRTGVGISSNLSGSPLWIWFFLGGLIALGIVALVNWRRL